MTWQEVRSDVRGRAQTVEGRPVLEDRCAPVARCIAVVIAAVVVLGPVAAQACSVCFGSSPNDPFSRGITWGILFMMTMPFAVAGVIGGWLLYMYRPWRRAARWGKEPLLTRHSAPQSPQPAGESMLANTKRGGATRIEESTQQALGVLTPDLTHKESGN